MFVRQQRSWENSNSIVLWEFKAPAFLGSWSMKKTKSKCKLSSAALISRAFFKWVSCEPPTLWKWNIIVDVRVPLCSLINSNVLRWWGSLEDVFGLGCGAQCGAAKVNVCQFVWLTTICKLVQIKTKTKHHNNIITSDLNPEPKEKLVIVIAVKAIQILQLQFPPILHLHTWWYILIEDNR